VNLISIGAYVLETFIFPDKGAKLSSVLAHHTAEKAVDGIYETIDGSMAHSDFETRPWWRVDLGDVHCVWAVNILNRYKSKLNSLSG